MYGSGQSRVDLHVHSKHSDRPSEWFLRRVGAPECFVEPRDVYRRACDAGMSFVTISDHNSIAGALEIADLPGTFLSSEITTYFPEDGCKIHCLVFGISEAQFRDIQEVRASIYDLREYLVREDILHSVAHPLFRVNDRLSIDSLEKLILMFSRFETLNGSRDGRASQLAAVVLSHLTPDLLARLADRHGIEPAGPEPWKKVFTGGSDDHSGVYVGSAHTVTPLAANVDELLAHLRRGDHVPAGGAGNSVMLGHGLYHIAYRYYKDRFLATGGKPNLIGELFRRLLLEPHSPQPSGATQKLRGLVKRLFWSRQVGKLSDVERTLMEEFSQLFQAEPHGNGAGRPRADRHTFDVACRISQAISYNVLCKLERYVREGRLVDSVQALATLAPVALSIAPYLAAFFTQHKDEPFLRAVAEHFPDVLSRLDRADRKGWITDTFSDINGVARTIQALGTAARRQGRRLTVITCLDPPPRSDIDLRNFRPVGRFRLPEYPSQELCFPPFLEMIEYIERQRFAELIVSTPGPLGLTALAAGRLLGLRLTGIYHTDFPALVRHLTQDATLEQLAWKYMSWFYDQMDRVLVPTECYRRQLIRNGFQPEKLSVMLRGVDLVQFQPSKREEGFWKRYGLDADFVFLYVGRISPEKNVHLVLDAFEVLAKSDGRPGLAIVGDGPSAAQLKARYRHARIAFTGFLEGETLARAYASSNALVFPSTFDTFGNVVIEAQASGLPVIVADRGGPAEIVGRNDSGLIVEPGRPGALFQAMRRLCDDPRLCSELRQRGLDNAAQSGWDQALERFWRQKQTGTPTAALLEFRDTQPDPDSGLISLETA